MWALIVFLVILTGLIGVVGYFFSLAFMRKEIINPEDMQDATNHALGDLREKVAKGIEHINSMPCKWVELYSFDKLRLKARYFDNGGDTTILLFHGYRSCGTRDFSSAFGFYYSLGFNILLPDQRSHGRSEGRLITFGVKEKRDVLSWAEFVNNKYSPENMILCGLSMGASTVLLAAGEELPENVKAVIADCGYTSPEAIIKSVSKRFLNINANIFLPVFDLICRATGGFSLKNASVGESLKKCKIPVLLIHGEDDTFVPCQMSRENFKSCNKESRLLTVEKATHSTSFLVDEKKVGKEIKEFLIKSHCLQSFH